jgi:hypothetical protein
MNLIKLLLISICVGFALWAWLATVIIAHL